jgi:hypothetical protein
VNRLYLLLLLPHGLGPGGGLPARQRAHHGLNESLLDLSDGVLLKGEGLSPGLRGGGGASGTENFWQLIARNCEKILFLFTKRKYKYLQG